MNARGNSLLRSIDRYLGIPIVSACGLAKRRRTLPERIERIGLLNSTNVGDTILLSAVAGDVSRVYPETILYTSPAMLPLSRLLPGLRAVPLRLLRPRESVRMLRGDHLDVLLDFDQWPRVQPVYALFSGARWTGGFRAAGQHRHYGYDGVVDHSDQCHELENYRRLAALLRVDSQSLPEIEPRRLLAPEELPQRPYVVFHLWPTGVKSALKEWPWQRWRELAVSLHERGYTLVLTGSAADSQRTDEFIEFCAPLGADLVHAAGAYDLAQVVDLLAGSHCVVSVNTGVMHLAAATGVATVALNGPTAERRWGPIGKRAVSVNSSYEDCGYLHFGWEYSGRREDCMLGIDVERVLAAVLELTGGR